MSDILDVNPYRFSAKQAEIAPTALALVSELGGSYAAKLGIDLGNLEPSEIYKWFLAAVLYGARISENIATRTWHVFENNGVLTPESIINIGWDGLVAILDKGGYVRYDYKTATKLLAINHALLDEYGGDLNNIHTVAKDANDLERRIINLSKGIGKVTADIFLRELRGKWKKAKPPLSSLAFSAARALGFLPDEANNDCFAITNLQRLWCKEGMTIESFSDFEAALTRQGLCMRRDATHISTKA